MIQSDIYTLSSFHPSLATAFPFQINLQKHLFFSNFSTQSIGIFDVSNSIRMVSLMEDMHKKRINDIVIEDKVLFSCSNDGSVKIFDLNSNKQIKKFQVNKEIFSLSKQGSLLAGGSESNLHFWYFFYARDLKTMTLAQTFNESHGDDITKVKFHPTMEKILISCSTDGLLCVFDLTQDSEENATSSMINLGKPLLNCDFYQESLAYATSSQHTISFIDLQTSYVQSEIDINKHVLSYMQNDLQNYYLIDTIKDGQHLSYYTGERFDNSYQKQRISRCQAGVQGISECIQTRQSGEIRCLKRLENGDLLTGSEDSSFQIVKGEQEMDLDQMEQSMFQEDQVDFSKKYKYQKKSFKPY